MMDLRKKILNNSTSIITLKIETEMNLNMLIACSKCKAHLISRKDDVTYQLIFKLLISIVFLFYRFVH